MKTELRYIGLNGYPYDTEEKMLAAELREITLESLRKVLPEPKVSTSPWSYESIFHQQSIDLIVNKSTEIMLALNEAEEEYKKRLAAYYKDKKAKESPGT